MPHLLSQSGCATDVNSLLWFLNQLPKSHTQGRTTGAKLLVLVPWPVCFMDWWIQTWNLLHKHGSRNHLYALCPTARRIPLSALKPREAYMILASLSPCFFWWLWNLLWLIFWIIFIISPIWAYQGCPPSNLQWSVVTGMVASVFLARIIRNSIPFVCMNATTAYSHASQDPCVHL
jgi:hypothetical protein